ncbi:hypothetical protein SDC9_119381 [bioreactor metagenome]|uniref:Uncharacterized protein n=1 Tax=bioreactor metagenome TaxID=1076179 RepID=A0A645C4D1_9ZZZZ
MRPQFPPDCGAERFLADRKKRTLDEAEIMAVFQEMANGMSENLFDGNVRLVLSDNKFQPLKTLE